MVQLWQIQLIDPKNGGPILGPIFGQAHVRSVQSIV